MYLFYIIYRKLILLIWQDSVITNFDELFYYLLCCILTLTSSTNLIYNFCFTFTLFPAYSIVGRETELKHSFLHFLTDFPDTLCWQAKLNTMFRLSEEGNWKKTYIRLQVISEFEDRIKNNFWNIFWIDLLYSNDNVNAHKTCEQTSTFTNRLTDEQYIISISNK